MNPTRIKLRHLILDPQWGLCNRLRALASARRLCHLTQARCSTTWTWGGLHDNFGYMPDVQVYLELPEETGISIEHKLDFHAPEKIRRVDVVTAETVMVRSGYYFWGSHEAPLFDPAEFRRYFPEPSLRLKGIVDEFHAMHLNGAVGFHIRRTDHALSRICSPDELFVARARKLVAAGKRIFLATDNSETELKFKQLFGDALVTYPKQKASGQRTLRQFDRPSDVIDLFLLAKTEYVVGSFASSYSQVASLLNGSKECVVLRNWLPYAALKLVNKLVPRTRRAYRLLMRPWVSRRRSP